MKKVGNKVVVVGTGSVGISYAYSMLNQTLCDDLVLIDLDHGHTEGEARDSRHEVPYAISPTQIYVGDYGDCSDAGIVCIHARPPQRPGETRLDLIDNDLRVLRSTVTAVMVSGLDGIFLVATNPADMLSYMTWRFSGLPKEHVIGSGTIIDSTHFHGCLGNEFNVAPWSVDMTMIGEYGDNVIVVWSTVNISGMSVEKTPGQEEGGKARMEKIYSSVRNAAYEVIETKGSASRDIDMGLSRISSMILHSQGAVLPVPSLLEDELKQKDVYIDVPTVVSRQGAMRIIGLDLSDDETEQFARSAELLKSYQREADDFMAAR